jgi:hypothetical protein
MVRTFQIALFSAAVMLVACKKTEQPPRASAEPVAKAAPAQPADPAKPADPAAKPDPGNNPLEAKGVAMMKQMSEVFIASQRDCEKLAVDLKGFIDQHKDLLVQLAAMEKQQTEQERTAFEIRNRAAQQEVLTKVGPTLEACQGNKNVEAAMKQLTAD